MFGPKLPSSLVYTTINKAIVLLRQNKGREIIKPLKVPVLP